MVKAEVQKKVQEKKANKTHKTLRDKLRKKRQQLKKHKKEKSEQKKQYNAEEEKLKYFSQVDGKQQSGRQLKTKKLNKYIQKFINIYEDDLDEFYNMFSTLDQNGFIDISGLDNKALLKCIKKMFKCLPLKKEQNQYRKVEGSKLCLEKFMKQKVSQSIQNYLENGSQAGESNEQSSGQENQQKQKKKAHKKQAKQKKKVKQQSQELPQNLRLYKQTITEQPSSLAMGPYIPPQVRQKMAQMFEQELQKRKEEREKELKDEEDQFSNIFSMSKTRKQIKQGKTTIAKGSQSVPEHLMAAGSAIIGQKVEVDDNEIEQYNRIHRPKKLIEMHKQLKGTILEDPKKRKSFDRERDILGAGRMSLMNNSTFFDFKSRMSKPQGTNQFL